MAFTVVGLFTEAPRRAAHAKNTLLKMEAYLSISSLVISLVRFFSFPRSIMAYNLTSSSTDSVCVCFSGKVISYAST